MEIGKWLDHMDAEILILIQTHDYIYVYFFRGQFFFPIPRTAFPSTQQPTFLIRNPGKSHVSVYLWLHIYPRKIGYKVAASFAFSIDVSQLPALR